MLAQVSVRLYPVAPVTAPPPATISAMVSVRLGLRSEIARARQQQRLRHRYTGLVANIADVVARGASHRRSVGCIADVGPGVGQAISARPRHCCTTGNNMSNGI